LGWYPKMLAPSIPGPLTWWPSPLNYRQWRQIYFCHRKQTWLHGTQQQHKPFWPPNANTCTNIKKLLLSWAEKKATWPTNWEGLSLWPLENRPIIRWGNDTFLRQWLYLTLTGKNHKQIIMIFAHQVGSQIFDATPNTVTGQQKRVLYQNRIPNPIPGKILFVTSSIKSTNGLQSTNRNQCQ